MGIRAVIHDADVAAGQPADAILEAGVVAHLLVAGLDPVLARDGREIVVIAVGRRNLSAVHNLKSLAADDTGFGRAAVRGIRLPPIPPTQRACA